MSNIVMCVGRYAEKPFYVKYARVSISSIEELCYFLCENAELLDRDIMNEELINWIDEECGLPELSRKLLSLLHLSGSLRAFVSIILEDVCYRDPEEIYEIGEIIKANEGISIYERMKKRADAFLMQDKQIVAIRQYLRLLSELRDRDPGLKERVLHNLGTACAGLFYFDLAADFYHRAYEINGSQEEQKSELICKRLMMEKADYVSMVTGQEEVQDLSLEIEETMENLLEEWRESEKYQELCALREKKEENDKTGYYRGTHDMIQEWKEEYSSMSQF